jgi:FkbM family methyltransferase
MFVLLSYLLTFLTLYLLYLYYLRSQFTRSPVFSHLPNGLKFYFPPSSVDLKTAFYEIFIDQNYWHHNIKLNPRASSYTIIDLGANCGLFVTFLSQQAKLLGKSIQVHAFEPIPTTYRLLSLNTDIHRHSLFTAHLYPYGVSNTRCSSMPFSHYPGLSIASSQYEQENNQRNRENSSSSWLIAFIHDGALMYQQEKLAAKLYDFFTHSWFGWLLLWALVFPLTVLYLTHLAICKRLFTQYIPCQLERLEDIPSLQPYITSSSSRIDLVKIDVEGAEMDVLNGISNEFLSKIDQFVIEVHDVHGERLKTMKSRLEDNGFIISIEQEKWKLHQLLHIYTLFARKKNLNY